MLNGTIELGRESQSIGSFIGEDVILGNKAEVHLLSGWNAPDPISTPPAPATKLVYTPSAISGALAVDNYPNPFNPATTIHYQLPEFGQVRLSVYNALGQEVRVRVDRPQPMGVHRVQWDGRE